MDFTKIIEIIDSKYHHNLYYSGSGVNLTFDKKNRTVNSFDTIDNIFNEKPGFWFSLSEDKVIRCGTHVNIKHKLNLFLRIEVKILYMQMKVSTMVKMELKMKKNKTGI